MIFTSKKVTEMLDCDLAMGIQMRGRNSRQNRAGEHETKQKSMRDEARKRERPSRRARKSRRYGRYDGWRVDLSYL